MLDKKFSLNKKFCLITGAAGLLGHEHAEAILEINGNLILTDIDSKKLKKMAKNIKNKFKKANILFLKWMSLKLKILKKFLIN